MKPVTDPMLRRLLAERYPSPLALSFQKAFEGFAPAVEAFAKCVAQLQGRAVCRMCGKHIGHHKGCPLDGSL